MQENTSSKGAIKGICIDANCKAPQRLVCDSCTNDHKQCDSVLSKEEFFKELQLIKNYTKQILSMQINVASFQYIKNELQRKILLLEQGLLKIHTEQSKQVKVIAQIDEILQKPSETSCWLNGYQLMMQKFQIEHNEGSHQAFYESIKSIRQSVEAFGELKSYLKYTCLIDNQAMKSYLSREEIENKQEIMITDQYINAKMMVLQLKCSNDGESFACADSTPTIRIFDLSGSSKSLIGHSQQINSLDFSPNDRLLVSGSSDKTVRVWDTRTCRQIANHIGHFKPVHSVCFSPSGLLIASGSMNLILIKALTNQKYVQITQTMPLVRSISISGGQLLAATQDKVFRVWRINSGALAYRSFTRNPVLQAKVSPNGTILASAEGPFIKIHRRNKLINRLKNQCLYVNTISYSQDGRFIVSGFDNGVIRIWNTMDRKQKLIQSNITTVEEVEFLNSSHIIYPKDQGLGIHQIDFQ